jgi:hypothetical protein
MRFQFLIAGSIKMTAFWDMSPCSLVEVGLYRRFKGAYCLHHQVHDGSSTHLFNVEGCQLAVIMSIC